LPVLISGEIGTGKELIAQDAALREVKFEKAAELALTKYDWPGNARELSNVLERTLSSIGRNTITLGDLPFYLTQSQRISSGQNPNSLKKVHDRAEKEAILK
jgi:transcriptional regulator with PAS, ATPase and Fis domain